VLTMLLLLAVIAVLKAEELQHSVKRPTRILLTLGWITLAILIAFSALALDTGVYNIFQAKSTHPISLLKAAKHAWRADDYHDASAYWQYRLDSFGAITKGSHSVWSTYASLYESQAGIFQPSKIGADYIVHAMGPERRSEYEQQFITSKPDFAITLRQSYFPYEEWLWQRHWNLYQNLLAHYEIVKADDSHFLWKRKAVATPTNEWQVAKIGRNGNVSIDPHGPGQGRIFEVKIDYSAVPVLPFTKNLPRYLIKVTNSAIRTKSVLPPYETSWQFPISYFAAGQPIVLKPEVDGLFAGKLTIRRVEYREVNMSDADRGIFLDAACFDYDKGWSKSPACTTFLATKY
jgi:hypothetical protein